MYKYSGTCKRASYQNQFGERQRPTRVKMLWSLLFISLISLGSAELRTKATDASCEQNYIPLQGRRTSQSSVYIDDDHVKYVSERAVDGKQDICAHTQAFNNSWWTVDLGGVYNISCISIYNVNQENINLHGAEIHIGNSSENNSTANNLCKTITDFNLGRNNIFKCDTAMLGRIVTVSFPGENHIILCEVKIYGVRTDSPFELVKKNTTWEGALYHCRDKYSDLASIIDSDVQTELAYLVDKEADSPFVWLGLHYTCTLEFWFWVDEQHSDFEHWHSNEKTGDCGESAAMQKHEGQHWFSISGNEMYNFICAK